MKILNGKKLSEEILNKIKIKIRKNRLNLKLAIVLVGKDASSLNFIKQKERVCKRLGIGFKLYNYQKNVVSKKLAEEVRNISADNSVSGVVIQLPLPKGINTDDILNSVPSKKDPDVLSKNSSAKFYSGDFSLMLPTIAGIAKFFDKYKIKIEGKNAVVVGNGRLVGKPAVLWLKAKKAKVVILNSKIKKISDYVKKADILICGTGKAGLINGLMVKNGVVVIDAGSNIKKGKIFGDVDFKSVSKKASYITPVPGGVGPMTVAMLMENLVKLNS